MYTKILADIKRRKEQGLPTIDERCLMKDTMRRPAVRQAIRRFIYRNLDRVRGYELL
jgi:hypothetical protein